MFFTLDLFSYFHILASLSFTHLTSKVSHFYQASDSDANDCAGTLLHPRADGELRIPQCSASEPLRPHI